MMSVDEATMHGGSHQFGDTDKDSNPKDLAALQAGRVPLSLFPDTAIIGGAMAMLEGACKYGRFNYRIVGVRASVYVDAESRHMKAWNNGEDIDTDSGLPHLYKALACIAILIDAEECGMLTDDRPPRSPVADMLSRLKPVARAIAERLKDFNPRQYTIKDTP